jgi:hypothetical protein
MPQKKERVGSVENVPRLISSSSFSRVSSLISRRLSLIYIVCSSSIPSTHLHPSPFIYLDPPPHMNREGRKKKKKKKKKKKRRRNGERQSKQPNNTTKQPTRNGKEGNDTYPPEQTSKILKNTHRRAAPR